MATTLMPFRDVDRWLDMDRWFDVDRWFRSFFDAPMTNGTGFAPAADVDRDGEDLVARFVLPCIDPD